VSDLTDEQNEIMLELFDNVHDTMHMMRNMAEGMYEAVADMEHSLLEALKCLDPDPPNMDNVVLFPTEKVSDET
tara:strand:- start:680 stop:901 length:222 start_codon:yes stop_codon:yes gene_type:complete